jgi:2-oxoglutarate ferredoxin oxidoreductase subunit gamma
MQEEVLFAGFGGQGVMFVGQLLAYAGMDEGLEVTWIPSYGPEMRGGTAHCYVVLSDKPIGSPIVRNPKVAIAFNKPSFEKYESFIAPDGLLVYNASLIDLQSSRTDIRQLAIPATDIADELGSAKVTNLVLLAATLAARPILPLTAIRRAVEEHIPVHRRNLLPLNFEALEKGAAFAENLVTI